MQNGDSVRKRSFLTLNPSNISMTEMHLQQSRKDGCIETLKGMFEDIVVAEEV